MLKVNQLELTKRNKIKEQKPYVYQKMLKLNDKLKNGESIAIIQFQYNYVCNFKCQHCSIKRFQGKQNRKKFTTEDVKSLSKQADQMGLARFVITGGEPLIFKDFDQLVRAIDPQKFYINVDTNGWYLDLDKAKHLKQIGCDRIQLSIDSLDAQDHDNFRNMKGSHQRAMNAIKASKQADLEIFVQTVVTKTRLHSKQFIDFIEFFNNQGITVFVTYAKPVGAWQGHYEQLVDMDDINYFKQLEKKYNICTHLTPAYGRDMGCIAVKGMISITQYGDVLPCPYMHISIGNVFKESLKTVIDKGLSIKWFGQYVDTCPIAQNLDFIKQYIENGVYGKPVPVDYNSVFTQKDKTNKMFNITMIEQGKFK